MAPMLGSSDAELLEKAANNKLNSPPETEEYQIQGSPFKIVREKSSRLGEEFVCFAAWGKGKMTQDFKTPEEVTEWIDNNYWNFLITVLTMAMDSRDLFKIEQMMKHAKESAKKEEDEKYEQQQREHTLHMEIERLKKEEAEEEKLMEIKDEYANKLGYKVYQ